MPVFKINGVFYSVFRDNGLGFGGVKGHFGALVPAAVLRQSFACAQGEVVALVNAGYLRAGGVHDLAKQGVYGVLYHFHAVGRHLGHKYVAKAVNGQSGKTVGFAEYHAAGGGVVAHHTQAVAPGVFYAPAPEVAVEFIVRVARDKAHSYLALKAQKAGADVAVLGVHNIDKTAVPAVALGARHIAVVQPRVSRAEPTRALVGNDRTRKFSFDLHMISPFALYPVFYHAHGKNATHPE